MVNVVYDEIVEGRKQVAGYVGGRWLHRGKGNQIPTYENFILGIKALSGAEREKTLTFSEIESLFEQTTLRRYEFVDMIQHAIAVGDLERSIFLSHPFENEMRTFNSFKEDVLRLFPNPRYTEHSLKYRN